jgi:hypothetical protein
MFIPDPGSGFLSIPDLGSRIHTTATKEGGKKISCPTFFCGFKYQKIENYLIFEQAKNFESIYKEL